MGLLARLRRFLFAAIHEVFDRVEKPARKLNYQILELRENLERAREHVAGAMAAERRIAAQATDAECAEDQWHQRARRAIEHGEDELAREALLRKHTARELVAYYHRAHEQQSQSVAALRSSLKRLELRLLELKARRAHLLARLGATHARQLVARSLRQAVGTDAFETFDRIAFQSDIELQQVLALTELIDDPDEAFIVAGRNHHVESEFSTIKRELGFVEPKALEKNGDRR